MPFVRSFDESFKRFSFKRNSVREQQTVGRTEAESHVYAEGFEICFTGYANGAMASLRHVHFWIGFGIRVNSVLAPLNDYCHHLPKASPSANTLSSNPSSPTSPLQSYLWDIIICRPLSSADGHGWIYVFREGRFVYKVGRTNNVERRAREWKYTCHAYPQIWLAAFWTPYAHRTERLVHIALEAICDSRPRIRCACQKTHIEKFVFKGQRDVVEQIIMLTIVFVIATVYGQYGENLFHK
ncbi:hypothetical protein EV368DRAFT_61418 [Lentinula lateritia]|uniref:Uncharacterized protein n=1 Tax=Lentinula aff. lateritia TaxID=2804960 RepID=A0ACC1U162_9AGAR|nr:hypothetical protein F5876DRAFT_65734 [Lentinula aff. lateritia]KAJ3856737.1 hypothetical protein EV368DRAFT_61418 [Lentinula lateritia]